MLLDFFLACALAFAVSTAACRLVIAAGVEDAPTMKRKAHRAPTPTSAGFAIGIGYAAGVCALVFPAVREWSQFANPHATEDAAIAMIAAFVFLGIGAIDDLCPLAAKPKFWLFAAASLTPPFFDALRADAIGLGAGTIVQLPWLIALLGSAFWIFTVVNVVNFMDGANGLAMGSTAIGLFFLALVVLQAGGVQAAALSLCGAAALCGFLVWNFPHGRLFAGDSGALFAGALAAILSLLAVRTVGVSPLVPAILFFPMLADALLTLVWRLSRGANIFDGHREHLYQIAIRAGVGHSRVTLRYWTAAAACGAIGLAAAFLARGGLAFAGLRGEADRIAGLIASYAPSLALAAMLLVALATNARVRRIGAMRKLGEA